MRISHLFGRTLREAPADAELPSHRLLVRGGFIRPLGSGMFSLLPLGWRVTQKVERIIREEMNAIGGQEMLMPVVHPAEIWRETGRYDQIDASLTRFKDRAGRDLVLAMTHEEVVTDLARSEISSYRQLPQIIYHLQTKWRDEPRARGGLIRVREFTMKDSYSLDRDEAGMLAAYERHRVAYDRIYRRTGLDFYVVGADTGMMGGKLSEEFMAPSPFGEDIILISPSGDYAANREVATFRRDAPPAEDALPMEEVATPATPTIEALAELLGVPTSRTAKAVFFTGDTGRLIFAVIRGDLEVNETKLRKVTGEANVTPATTEAIRAAGADPGYASPVGLPESENVLVVADLSIRDTPNLVAGANRTGFHLRNVNYGRDWRTTLVEDIASAEDGFLSPTDGAPLRAERAIEVGNIFALGDRYTAMLGATYLDEQGESRPIQMGSYGIGSGRLVASLVEQNYDDRGIVWPAPVAPFSVYLTWIGKDTDTATFEAAEGVYDDLRAVGVDVLFDDRTERPGVKFADAELIGCPLRLSVSSRTLAEGQAELRARTASESELIPLGDVVAIIEQRITDLMAPFTLS